MKRDQYWGRPKTAKVKGGEAESWWYANERWIDLHVQPQGTDNHITIRLSRSELVRYIEQTRPQRPEQSNASTKK